MTEHELNQMQDYEDQSYKEDVVMAKNDRFKMTAKAAEEKIKMIDASDGIYLFPPVGNTRVRLLLEPDRVADAFYQPVLRSYEGKERVQHMMHVLLDGDVKIMCCAKTVTKGILTIIAGGEYDLLHPDNGHEIIINRSGEGLKTKYSVMTGKSPLPVDYDFLEFEDRLADKAAEMELGDREPKDDKENGYEDVPW